MSNLKTNFRLMAEDRLQGFAPSCIYPLLEVASWFYGMATGVTRTLHESKILSRKKLPFPVISVGNLTWGGTGKTPFVEFLARKMIAYHKTPLVLTRGYSHDEVEQMKHHIPRVLMGVGQDRYRVAQNLAKTHKIDVAILDDGFQHWSLHRDLDIVVVNSINPFGNGKMIPRGILREPFSRLKKASIIVLTHSNLISINDLKKLKKDIQKAAPQGIFVEAFLEPLFFYRADRKKRVSMDRLQHQRVTTFSGVGMPRSFQLLLSRCQIRTARNFEFSDHHMYSEGDLKEIRDVSDSASIEEIITTEKDFYRAPEAITKILNPLILATRLRIASGENLLSERLASLIGVRP